MMSPNSRASLMRSATSRRFTVERCSMSASSFFRPSLVMGISRATSALPLPLDLGTNAARDGRRLTSQKPPDSPALGAHGVGQARNYSERLQALNRHGFAHFEGGEQASDLVERGGSLVGVSLLAVHSQAVEIPGVELPEVAGRAHLAPMLRRSVQHPT